MHVIFITIFPHLITQFCAESLLGKAQTAGTLSISTINPRDFADVPHRKVDDIPYGGGAGMVMLAEPLLKSIRHARTMLPHGRVILLSPAGTPFSQPTAQRLSGEDLIFVCGRYEGIDQRVIEAEVDEELSIGDFILMGGEVAALCILEATARLLPGILGNSESTLEESFDSSGMLEAPSYTRPASLPEGEVPAVLLSGNHKAIAQWRSDQRSERTKRCRPDLTNRSSDDTRSESVTGCRNTEGKLKETNNG